MARHEQLVRVTMSESSAQATLDLLISEYERPWDGRVALSDAIIEIREALESVKKEN